MTRHLVLIGSLLNIWITSFAQTSFRVSYPLPIVQSTMSTDTSFHHDVSYDIWQTAMTQTAQAIKNGSQKIYDNMGKRITIEEIIEKLSTRDTVMMINPYTLEESTKEILTPGYLDADICGFSMNEKWTVGNDGMIEKSILRYAPLYPHISCHKALYWIYPTPIISKHQTTNVEYVVDFSSFEDSRDSAAFVSLLMSRIQSGEARAFNPQEENPKLLSKEGIDNLFKSYPITDTVTAINPITLEETTSIYKREGQNKIDRIKFREEWMIDSKGNFQKYIREYLLMTCYYDQKGILAGWVPFLIIRNKDF